MTVGEKIQHYRKCMGLSQDELGQRLMVSRQTVSLWEMDKTLPTIDNLLLLKEIFNVNVDDLLSNEPLVQAQEAEIHISLPPLEQYRMEYEKQDLKKLFKKKRRPVIWARIAFVLFLILGYAALFVLDISVTMFSTACTTLLIVHFVSYLSYRIRWNKNANRMCERVYTYIVYDGYFTVKAEKDGELVWFGKSSFSEIERVQVFGDVLILQAMGQTLVLHKNELVENSAFLFDEKGIGREVRDVQRRYKKISLLLFAATIASFLVALFISSRLNLLMGIAEVEGMQCLLAFIPVSLFTFAFSFIVRRKGLKTHANMTMIVGIVMTVYLATFGGMAVESSQAYSHDDAPILKAEEMIEVDIPTHKYITTQNWTKDEQASSHGLISVSDVVFDQETVLDFEASLSQDARWLAAIPNDLLGLSSDFLRGWRAYEFDMFDFCLIYNATTGDVNALPGESGTYRMINLMYNKDKNLLRIVEYEVQYTK